jgi:hypothetical protein
MILHALATAKFYFIFFLFSFLWLPSHSFPDWWCAQSGDKERVGRGLKGLGHGSGTREQDGNYAEKEGLHEREIQTRVRGHAPDGWVGCRRSERRFLTAVGSCSLLTHVARNGKKPSRASGAQHARAVARLSGGEQCGTKHKQQGTGLPPPKAGMPCQQTTTTLVCGPAEGGKGVKKGAQEAFAFAELKKRPGGFLFFFFFFPFQPLRQLHFSLWLSSLEQRQTRPHMRGE